VIVGFDRSTCGVVCLDGLSALDAAVRFEYLVVLLGEDALIVVNFRDLLICLRLKLVVVKLIGVSFLYSSRFALSGL